MKRTLWNQLIDWKKSTDRKPLIIRGARQVGKTWLMQAFGQTEYKNVIYINCDDEPRMKELFAPDYDMHRILLGLQAISGIKPEPDDTLIILDEIQEVPRGLASLKYFYEKAPAYHLMVAGSLLGIALHEGTSFPVGKVDMLTLYPLTFEEFLDAAGRADLVSLLRDGEWGVLDVVANKLEELLRQYYYVGGMPAVVSSFISDHDLAKVRRLQETILEAYRNDISKHAGHQQTERILMVFRSIPSQLAKENKKFIYGAMKKGARAKEFEVAIQWLIDCGIIYKVGRVTAGRMPLSFYEDLSSFKLYMLDCGLFAALAGAPASEMLVGKNVFAEFSGAFTEEFVLQQLVSLPDTRVYYWTSKSDAELDFVVQRAGEILPIEVKAEVNVKARSLRVFTEEYRVHGLRFSMLPYKEQSWMTNYPLYSLPVRFSQVNSGASKLASEK